jgi:hypothetical protein
MFTVLTCVSELALPFPGKKADDRFAAIFKF